MKRKLGNKGKYYLCTVFGYVVAFLPLLIYGGINAPHLTKNNVIGLSITGALVLCCVLLTAMCKIKIKTGIWIVVVAVLCLVLANIASILGYALLCAGIGLALDGYIFKRLALRYKERWYGETGKTITYSKRLD